VCHHNPLHRGLRRQFPVRIVREFGFSHSLHIDGPAVRASYARTPARWPWIIHASEGVDAEAAGEIDALESLGCLGENTVLVHGVGIDEPRARRVLRHGGALVWCPSSNAFLFGRTADVRGFDQARRIALGTDSRLSGQGDLLDELRVARATGQLSPERLVRSVTVGAADVLRLPDAGRLNAGNPADLIVIRRRDADPFVSVLDSRRTDLALSMIGGAPLIGDPAMHAVFPAGRRGYVMASVDGADRLIAPWIARRIARMRLTEPGLELAS
jgi:cytosine/adenosine deaminase-related metal-dependent hydrolase